MERPCPAGAMCKPHFWAVSFQSLKMPCVLSSVLQAAKYKLMSTNTDNIILFVHYSKPDHLRTICSSAK